MQPAPLQGFDHFRRLAAEKPEAIVDPFIDQYNHLTSEQQQAFLAIRPERETMIEGLRRGSRATNRPLGGIPYLLEDLFDVATWPTRCGAPFATPFEAEVTTSSLLQDKLTHMGASCFGKTVPAEFGVRREGTNPTFGDCPHPDGPDYLCGGGAGSCGYGVAAGWAPLAFGLDSRAGIRVPAAFHGLFGLRMEHNRMARNGVFPVVPSIESVGALVRSASDLKTLYQAFYPAPQREKQKRPRGCLWSDADNRLAPGSRKGMRELLRAFDIDDSPEENIHLSRFFHPAAAALRTIENRELYHLHRYWIEEYEDDYEPKLLEKVKEGQRSFGPQADQAGALQQELRAAMMDFFRRYDFLVIPVSPFASPGRDEWNELLERRLQAFNAPLSLAMLPALILPYHSKNGSHNAVQILFNPNKPGLAEAIIDQSETYYGRL